MGRTVDLGIDFGTTNCAVGRITADGQASVRGPYPSSMAWVNERLVFEDEARALLAEGNGSAHPIRDLKLRLGTGTIRVGPLEHDPVVLAAELLRHLASKVIGQDDTVGTAVMGTPVQFNRDQRLALREAARMAGFGKVKFVYEPTAAVMAYVLGTRLRATVLVVDWGGGTLDLAVVRIENDVYQELSVDGDVNDLGGTRIDEAIMEQLLARTPENRSAVDNRIGGRDLLKQEIELVKIDILDDLDDSGEVRTINLPWLPKRMTVSPRTVTAVIQEFAERATLAIGDVVRRAGLQPDDITDVLFAGGTCRTELVRNTIMRLFARKPNVRIGPNPQLVTGDGCTMLTGNPFKVQLASDIAVRQSDGSLCVLIERGHPLELNAYRVGEFMVTDPHAIEAVIDIGLCHFDAHRQSMMAADAASFQSLKTIFLRVGQSELKRGQSYGDRVQVMMGVDENLAVAVFAQGNRPILEGRPASTQQFLSGVPLAIRIGGDGV